MTAQLAQCRRCQAYTLLDDGAVPVAVDVAPLDRDGYIAAVMGGVGMYAVEKRQSGPSRLRSAPVGTVTPSWSWSGLQEAVSGVLLHAEHPHPARDQQVVKPPAGPPQAPVTHGAGKGGNHPPTAPVASAQGLASRSAAGPVTRRHSDPYPKCGTCARHIKAGEMYWGIQHGPQWVMCEHEECPCPVGTEN